MRLVVFAILFFVLNINLSGQAKYDPDQLLVQLDQTARINATSLRLLQGVADVQLICPPLHTYKIIKDQNAKLTDLFDRLNRISGINLVSYDYYTELRLSPNDELYPSQWALDKIQAPDAWDTTTGGENFEGRTIVMAILDDGFDTDHEDLQDNIWINEFEIPGNGIDDDNNNYVDDVEGWNFDSNNDTHPAITHGTSVAGIAGASGDNGIGISGVNHQIKLMVLSGVNQASEIIEGYNYVYEQRKRFNETAGTQGAFVVSTNFSAGIGMTFPTGILTTWCDMYDLLGEQGILSSSAVDNNSYNVDFLGDMPTTCQSEFLITVTNTDQLDEFDGAYGQVNVDLGAPGEDILTTNTGDNYDNFPGTSAAAPHVGAAVALLQSVKCPLLATTAFDDPMESARAIKDAILNGVDQVPTLAEVTTSGGRLNLFESMNLVQLYCGGSIGELNIRQTSFDNDQIIFTYESPNFDPVQFQVFDVTGRTLVSDEIRPPSFGEKIITIDVSWPTGIYFARLINGEEETVLKFFYTNL